MGGILSKRHNEGEGDIEIGSLCSLDRFFRRDEYAGRVVHIHGTPYTYKARLGSGAFGNQSFADPLVQLRFSLRFLGAVYSGEAPNGMPVAIKFIDINSVPMQSRKIMEVYLNEVALLQRLRQESLHVVMIYDFDFDPQTGIGELKLTLLGHVEFLRPSLAYIVMELGGENLGKLIRRLRAETYNFGPAMSPFMIRDVWRQMVSIIGTLHGNGIVHMDLKPDNLIFFGSTLKIADLGISRKVDALG